MDDTERPSRKSIIEYGESFHLVVRNISTNLYNPLPTSYNGECNYG